MAIEFDCPHCKTHYRLKDDLGGKTATCKNPTCRKVIVIPTASAAGVGARNTDVDAIAAAAFADEPVEEAAGRAETIEVTCSGCDHVWSVEASKEGKNVLCPECRRPNRVPLRQKAAKIDWRTGGDGRPSLAKRETGMDVAGAFTTAQVGTISTQTAQQILRDREAEEEPEERRRRLLKRCLMGLPITILLAAAVYYAFQVRREVRSQVRMEDAVREVKEAGGGDPRYEALIHRASAEYRLVTLVDPSELKLAVADLQMARNRAKAALKHPMDRQGILAEVAVTCMELLGRPEVKPGENRETAIKEARQALQEINDGELRADALRAVVRACAGRGHAGVAVEIARQLGPEMQAQVGLELYRLNAQEHAAAIQGVVQEVMQADAPAVQALRNLVSPGGGRKEKDGPATVSLVASAEAAALRGDPLANLPRAVQQARVQDRVAALAAAAHAAGERNPEQVVPLLKGAGDLLKGEARGTVSPWLVVRVCRLYGRVGRADEGLAVADTLKGSEAAWAHLELLRARLANADRLDESWLDPLRNNPGAAAAKAHEEMARAYARSGQNYEATINMWEKGTLRPFGRAGTVLGQVARK